MLTRFDELAGPFGDDWVPWWPEVVSDEKWLIIAEGGGIANEAEPILERFTSETGEHGFYISYCTTTGTFTYCHWQAGKRLRTLEYQYEKPADPNPIWRAVEGEPEPWERSVYFNEVQLRGALSCNSATIPGEPDYSPEARQKLEDYWRTGVITKGEEWPTRSVRRVEWEIMLHYELPSYYVYLSREQKPPHG
jgi:hypothetical protein